jgi:epoxyqueuosine reductase QueG
VQEYKAGVMAWMAARADERSDFLRVLPGVWSIIFLAANYYTPHWHSREAHATYYFSACRRYPDRKKYVIQIS